MRDASRTPCASTSILSLPPAMWLSLFRLPLPHEADRLLGGCARCDSNCGRCFLILSKSVFRLPVVFLCSVCVATLPAAAQSPAQTQRKLKIYISVDMEGVAGVVTADQLGPAGFEYERFRHFMTNETLAAIRAAKESGASDVVVSDSHGNGESLLIDEFPKDVRIVRSWPRHGGMMAGLDASFDAAFFIGYHAS